MVFQEFNLIGKNSDKNITMADADIFKALFHAHCQALIYFAYRFVRDMHIAEDIVQEVFVKVWKNRNTLDFTENMETYLFTAVRNLSLKHPRHTDVKRKGTQLIQIQLGNVPTPDEILNYKEIETAVEKTIQDLPERCRQIFSMNRYDGLTYNEISKILNISVKTVETQMSRALRFLRKRLAHLLTSIL